MPQQLRDLGHRPASTQRFSRGCVTQPVRANAGEHVQITPAGQSSGNGDMSTRAEMYFQRLIDGLADRLNRGHRDNMQMAGTTGARVGGW